jgi:hypothetical protein
VNLEEGCSLLYDSVLLLGEGMVSISTMLEPFGCVAVVRQARTGCSPFAWVVLNFIGQLSVDLGAILMSQPKRSRRMRGNICKTRSVAVEIRTRIRK